jgi:hypothetical protein
MLGTTTIHPAKNCFLSIITLLNRLSPRRHFALEVKYYTPYRTTLDLNMTNTDNGCFRFLDLPSELRTKIYVLLLCAIFTQDELVQAAEEKLVAPLNVYQPRHDIQTAVLRVSRLVYREAFDVMVRVNRFVRIESKSALPLQPIFAIHNIPAIAQDSRRIALFTGAVLDIRMSTSTPLRVREDQSCDLRPCSMMMLSRDLHVFSQGILSADSYCPGFAATIVIDVHMAPLLDLKSPRYQGSFTDFFSEITQETLLASFRTLRSMDSLTIRGHVLLKIAQSITEEARKDEWGGEPQTIIKKLTDMKEDATKLFRSGNWEQASARWADATFEIIRMQSATAWDALVVRGGQVFVDKLAELLFVLSLNAAHAVIMAYSPSAANPMVTVKTRETYKAVIECYLDAATGCIQPGFWEEGITWTPTRVQLAKLHFRRAVYLSTWVGIEEAPAVLANIERAEHYAPNDPSIVELRDTVLERLGMGRQ